MRALKVIVSVRAAFRQRYHVVERRCLGMPLAQTALDRAFPAEPTLPPVPFKHHEAVDPFHLRAVLRDPAAQTRTWPNGIAVIDPTLPATEELLMAGRKRVTTLGALATGSLASHVGRSDTVVVRATEGTGLFL